MNASLWLVLVTLFTPPVGGGVESKAMASLPASTLCGTGAPRDTIHVRIIPPGNVFRIHPSASEIVQRGTDDVLVRNSPVWKRVHKTLCDPNLSETDLSASEFLPRIVIFVAGEKDRPLMSLEYPSWEDAPKPVRARIGGRMVLVPAATVRLLLDYSRSAAQAN